MLPRSARLTSPNDFARTTKSGFRTSSKFLVLYLYPTAIEAPARCGLIINKGVGGSVVRHKVARQIRHSVKEHLSKLSPGTLLVVRALPGSPMADIAKELSHLVPKTVAKTLVPQ